MKEIRSFGSPERRPRDRDDNTFFSDTYLEKNPYKFCPWCGAEDISYRDNHGVNAETVHTCNKCKFVYYIYPFKSSEVEW
jgi:predicted RNA-binding Zn-ribbon protein involved in translation (DUF1610 family)